MCKYGKLYKQVKIIMATYKSNLTETLIISHFNCVRNYIILNIFLRNAHRAGVLSKLRYENFLAAKLTENGKYIMDVKEHKTNKTYGNASRIVDKQFF